MQFTFKSVFINLTWLTQFHQPITTQCCASKVVRLNTEFERKLGLTHFRIKHFVS